MNPETGACALVLNAGSSSLKFALYDAASRTRRALGQVDGLLGTPRVRLHGAGLELDQVLAPGLQMPDALDWLLDWLDDHGTRLLAAAHRVVHGGLQFHAITRIDPAVLAALHALDPLAPLHQPHNLAGIHALAERLPELPQYACFDTGFHHDWPDPARRFALPRALHDAGIRRYGFHGLSYAWVARELRRIDPAAERAIIAHLGSGASVCAVRDGRSVDCTLGFTALDGLPMSTRCGALDPGVVPYLMRSAGYDLERVEDLLYRQSGLLGVSGISGDLRALEASGSPSAAEAIELLRYRTLREIGALAAVLGGVDAVVFTGGIGQHAVALRRAMLDGLRWLGLQPAAELAEPVPAADRPVLLHAEGSSVRAYAIATDEEAEMAGQLWGKLPAAVA